MKAELTIKELHADDLCQGLLRHFNRYQEVKRALRRENGIASPIKPCQQIGEGFLVQSKEVPTTHSCKSEICTQSTGRSKLGGTDEAMCQNHRQDTVRFNRWSNKWALKDVVFTEQWDEKMKQEIVDVDFKNCLKSGGFVWGVFNRENQLIAFACLLSDFFGSSGQYLQLTQIHVSSEYRNMGVGKELFRVAVEKARELGAEKLYISAHSSEESQYFYESIGCEDAAEVNERLAKLEPYDRQMEYVL